MAFRMPARLSDAAQWTGLNKGDWAALAGICLYVWLGIDPALQYSTQEPVFFTDPIFCQGFLRRPGGMLEYASAFLSQLLRYGWLGALLIGLILGGIRGLTQVVGRRVGAPHLRLVFWLPAGVLLGLASRYDFPLIQMGLALLVVLAAVGLYSRTPWTNLGLRLGWFLVLSGWVYYLVAGPFIIFVVCGVLYEVVARRHFALGVIGAGLAALAPFAGAWFFVLPWRVACQVNLPWGDSRLMRGWFLALYSVVPLCVLVSAWFGRLWPAALPSTLASGTQTGERPARPQAGAGLWLAHPWGPLVLVVMMALTSFDVNARLRAQVDCYAKQGKWTRVLSAARQLGGAYSIPTIVDVNRALGCLGRLGADMFAFPQRANAGLWLEFQAVANPRNYIKVADMLFELGQVNRAERIASEAMELDGYRPAALQRLALVYLAKGQPKAAGLFLAKLDRTLFYRDWVASYRRKLAADPGLAEDEEFSQIRAVMIHQDAPGDVPVETMLQQCLSENPRNRLAFEYLMAHYLLSQQLDKFQLNLPRLERMGYREVPRHYQEALLLHQKLNQSPELPAGRRMNPDVGQRFKRFHERFMRHRGNLAAARLGLFKDYGDTYWFFYMFGVSGPGLTPADWRQKP